MTTPHERAALTRKARTREKAIKAVEKMLKKAKNRTSLPRMEDIAAVADVGAATLYKTFGSRDQLLVEAFKDLVLRPMDEEVERLNKVSDLQPVQKLTFYFMALDKAADKGRWRLFQAANHSRIDFPRQLAATGKDIEEDDTILTDLARHIVALGRSLYIPLEIAEIFALRVFDYFSRGYRIDESLVAEMIIEFVEGTQLREDMQRGILRRVET